MVCIHMYVIVYMYWCVHVCVYMLVGVHAYGVQVFKCMFVSIHVYGVYDVCVCMCMCTHMHLCVCFWNSAVKILFKISKVSRNWKCVSSNLSRRLGRQCHLRTKQPASPSGDKAYYCCDMLRLHLLRESSDSPICLPIGPGLPVRAACPTIQN